MRVVGIGRESAGADGVGPAVVRALGREPLPGVAAGLAEPGDLPALVGEGGHLVLVDALVAPGEVGRVLTLSLEELRARGRPLSSHGLDVPGALALGRALAGDRAAALSVVAVTVGLPAAGTFEGYGLSPEVARAIPRAVAVVRELVANRSTAVRS